MDRVDLVGHAGGWDELLIPLVIGFGLVLTLRLRRRDRDHDEQPPRPPARRR